MQYTELYLLLTCGYFNPLDEIFFQSYFIYYIKYSIHFCLLNKLVNIIIKKALTSHQSCSSLLWYYYTLYIGLDLPICIPILR